MQANESPGKASNPVDDPLVSVIMPAYHVAEYIGTSIDSVLNQTFSDYEIIVVNDGSPDTVDLERALEPYRERIVYIKQDNLGCSAARNTAIRAARGEYIAFLDADDYWKADYLSEQIAFFKSNPTVDLVYTDALLVGDSPLAGRTFMETTPSEGEVTFEGLLGGRCTVILSATVVRRRAIEDVGLFDEELRYAEDYDLWLRLASNGARMEYRRKVLLCKRIHSKSLTADQVKLFEHSLKVLKRNELNAGLTENERLSLVQQMVKLRATLELEQGKRKLSGGDFRGAEKAVRIANDFYHSWKLRLALSLLRFSPRLLLRIYNFATPLAFQSKSSGDSYAKGDSLTLRAAWYLFAKTVAFLLSFALPLLLVRRLSQNEFGLYKQVFLVVGTALNVVPLGVGMSAFYFLPRERERQGQVVFNIILFYLLMAGAASLTLCLWPQLWITIFNSTDLVQYAPLIGVVILLWIISSFLEVAAVAHQEYRLATVFVIASQFSKTGLLLAGAMWFSSVWALIYAAIIHGLLQTIVLTFYLRSRFGAFWRSFKWPLMRKQLAYSLPLGIAAIIGVQSDLDNYFVSNRFGATAYAIYAIGCFQLPLVSILSDTVGSVMIPRVSYLQKFGRSREIIELTAKMVRKLSAIYFPLFLFLLLLGREFITVLFTSRYLASYPIFAINLTLIPLAILTSGCDPIMRAYAEHRYFPLKTRVAVLVVLVATLWLGTKRLGMVGTISIVIAVNLIERVVTAIKVGHILGLTRKDIFLLKDVGKVVVATAIAGAGAEMMRVYLLDAKPFVVLGVCGVVFSLLYVGGLLMLRFPTKRERNSIREQMVRMRRKSWKRAGVEAVEADY
jgi:glycosyltransferase involved in cell wall biosynthesis/Na+-driven multidrug efflux pump